MSGNAPPVVSVLISAYNVTQYIDEALDSVLAQTFDKPYEVIVVNDGCPDTVDLERALKPYQQHILYLKQPNGGPSSARNTAVAAARAPLVALLDADDVWLPEYLSEQVGRLWSDPTLDLIYPNMEIFGSAGAPGKLTMDLSPSKGEVSFDSLLSQTCTVMNCPTLKRDVILRAGMWDPNLRHSEDFDLWLRIAHQGGRMVYTRKPLARLRLRPGSLSWDSVKMYDGQRYVYEKVLRDLTLTQTQRALVQAELSKARARRTFELGKRAFFASDYVAARRLLAEANSVLRSPKTSFLISALRVAPGLLHGLARLRKPIFRT